MYLVPDADGRPARFELHVGDTQPILISVAEAAGEGGTPEGVAQRWLGHDAYRKLCEQAAGGDGDAAERLLQVEATATDLALSIRGLLRIGAEIRRVRRQRCRRPRRPGTAGRDDRPMGRPVPDGLGVVGLGYLLAGQLPASVAFWRGDQPVAFGYLLDDGQVVTTRDGQPAECWDSVDDAAAGLDAAARFIGPAGDDPAAGSGRC